VQISQSRQRFEQNLFMGYGFPERRFIITQWMFSAGGVKPLQ
jgi:hypothetical protein